VLGAPGVQGELKSTRARGERNKTQKHEEGGRSARGLGPMSRIVGLIPF